MFACTANARDRDNGEFMYSLRSLDAHAPWFNGDIFITLADGETPPRWLNLQHPRIKIIRHSQFFKNTSALPTFNSDAIHVNMHLIPELSSYDYIVNL